MTTLATKRKTPSTTVLLNWLQVAAHGGDIEREGQRWKLKPGIRQARRCHFDPIFVFTHARLHRALNAAMQAHESKWSSSTSTSSLRVPGRSDFVASRLRAQCAMQVRQ